MLDRGFGPEVVWLLPQHVRQSAPTGYVRRLQPGQRRAREHIEIALFKRVNRARRAAGSPLLKPSAALARMARRHSHDMRDAGFFGHRSPTRGNLAQRRALERIGQLTVTENLALASGVEQAHQTLLNSPAHRANMLDPALTHGGIGVAVAPHSGLLYVTEWFATGAPTP